ncbi:hypothetical protein RHMOL_Rhmol13G0165100 [Rhododendron molle]|uniref:Uncharacterized protein n=1 Tax=Rhododendron molle TaxID=49168 RepID=A0ACC0L8E3_RHOML|nr:hypothetical protein RHMOL_Rhmol13G0165100 [Rhododendron molle]
MLINSPLYKLFTSKTLMAASTKPSPFRKALPMTPSSHPRLSHSGRLIFSAFSSKPTSRFRIFARKNNTNGSLRTTNGSLSNGFSSVSHANIPRPVSQVGLEIPEDNVPIKLRQKMESVGIDSNLCRPGQYNGLICPMCKGGDSMEKSLSLFITQDGNSALWTCFRAKCGWRGSTSAFADGKSTYRQMSQIPKVKQIRKIAEESLELERPCGELLSYFAERMISRETLQRNSVMQRRWNDEIVIAFPYRRNGVLVSCKYRDINKKFWQEKDTEKILYGLDDIKDASDIIIVEGEMDKLSMEEAGFRNCVSVPDGAPATVSKKELPSEEQDTKYQYLWNCKEYLEKASRIILATDGDPPGQALAEELARRLGRERFTLLYADVIVPCSPWKQFSCLEGISSLLLFLSVNRCWRVRWPKKNDVGYFKDANEVLMYMGPGLLKEVIENAELYPIQGLFNFRDYFDDIDSYYHRTLGYEFGASTGWRCLDQLYNVVPGELTVVTGVPNSGKSEWIDALICNLNKSSGWKFALCSMENQVREHARKLLEKHMKRPFFDARYGESVERMSVDELEEGKKWLGDTFYLIRCENDSLPNINWVLKLAKSAVLRYGINGLVIDPYNELDHQRPPNQTETEYVSQMLTKMHHWVGAPPNLYDISGSAHFINKCDNGIVVHRNRDPDAGPLDQVQVCVRKVRNKVAGTIGEAFLSYNRVTGEYVDMG